MNLILRCCIITLEMLLITGCATVDIPNDFKLKESSKSREVDKSMVFVQGGTFQMGSNDGRPNEKPTHDVTIGDYYIGKYEVTIGEFSAFVTETGYKTDAEKRGGSWVLTEGKGMQKKDANWQNPYFYQTDKDPVVCVSYTDASKYCKWLSKKQDCNYRLPTEAEWEYAARGGNQNKSYKYSGSNNIDEVGWYYENSGDNKLNESEKTDYNFIDKLINNKCKTHPVGGKKANELGIYDMSGNVLEWCNDKYGDYQSGSQNDPTGPWFSSTRVVRGGSWSIESKYCQVTTRGRSDPDRTLNISGFRVVRLPYHED